MRKRYVYEEEIRRRDTEEICMGEAWWCVCERRGVMVIHVLIREYSLQLERHIPR